MPPASGVGSASPAGGKVRPSQSLATGSGSANASCRLTVAPSSFTPSTEASSRSPEASCRELDRRVAARAAARPECLRRLALLGAGSFGRVYLCGLDEAQVAVKKQAKRAGGQSAEEAIGREAALLRRVECALVVRLHASVAAEDHVLLVTEYVSGGTLFDRVRFGEAAAESDILLYAAQLAVALRHVHSCQVAYRDLKPQNVLLTREGNVKLCDFGWSRILRPGERSFTVCGTPEFMSPEQARAPQHSHSFECDWWALGMLVFELATGFSPFELPGAPAAEPMPALAAGFVPGLPAGYPAQLRSLTRGLLQADERLRAGWPQLCALRALRGCVQPDSSADDVLAATAGRSRHLPPAPPAADGAGFELFGSSVLAPSHARAAPAPDGASS